MSFLIVLQGLRLAGRFALLIGGLTVQVRQNLQYA